MDKMTVKTKTAETKQADKAPEPEKAKSKEDPKK